MKMGYPVNRKSGFFPFTHTFSFLFMTKFLLRTLLVAASALLFTSCLTVTETYTFKKNGSGTMEYTLDMSEMASLLAMAGQEDGGDATSEISMERIGKELEGISGISGVSYKDDKDTYVFKLSFKFNSLKALNEALAYVISNKGEEAETESEAYFTMEGNTIVYHRSSTNAPLGDELMGGEDAESMYSILESMKYNLNFSLPRSAAVVYTVGEATSGGKKNREVNVVANFREVAENAEALTTTIVMK